MAYAQDAAIQKLIALIKDALSDKQDKPDSGNYLTDIDVNIEQTGTGAILTVNGESVTLSNGQNGFSPTIRIINNNNGTTVVITDVTGTQSFDIMDGTDGADGQNGQDGFSPLVTVTKSGYDITLSITDENGTTTETFVDGSIAYSAFPSSLATGNPATFTDSVQNIPVDKLMVEILPNQPAGLSPGGNDDPTPTNIRPISGYSGDTITVTGDNDSDTYTIDWSNKSIVGTIGVLYGGTLDVTTGTLSVKWRSINIAGSNSYTYGSGYVQFSLSSSYRALYSAVPKFLSNQYKIFDNVQSTSYDHICVILNDNDVVVGMRIYDSRFTDATTTKALLNSHPVQICYVLLVVRTVQLTATQITLFLGNNSISSLDGVVSVIYRMNDTSSYLNAFKSMITGVEISYVATKNYATGNLVIVDNTLLHITDNIANGSDIIPGTNCVATTVAQEIISGGGGGGGTSDYTYLSNKPQINGYTLSGNQTGASLGLASSSDIPSASSASPQDLNSSASAGVSTNYSRADHQHKMPNASDVGAIAMPSSPADNDVLVYDQISGAWVSETLLPEITVSNSGAVSQMINAETIYHFTGSISSLTLTLNSAPANRLAQYHFDFNSGSTAATITVSGVTWYGGSFTPEANKHYEVDILNGYGVYLAW